MLTTWGNLCEFVHHRCPPPSFTSDWIHLGQTAWSHLLDVLAAVFGSYCFVYIFLWEHFDSVQWLIGLCGCVHAAASFA